MTTNTAFGLINSDKEEKFYYLGTRKALVIPVKS